MTEEQQGYGWALSGRIRPIPKYYDEFATLLGTGMRVSEFCGLTKSDLDFGKVRRIRVDPSACPGTGRQILAWRKPRQNVVVRFIPMTEEVYQSLKNILARRKRVKKRKS